MAAKTGREESFVWGGITLCAREKTLTLNGENIDASDGCSDGFQELLEESGTQSLEITLSGLDKDDVLLEARAEGPLIRAGTYTRKSGAVVAGDFRLSALSFGAPFNDVATYEATFSSSGEFTVTAA
jgi:predicted secreted protein